MLPMAALRALLMMRLLDCHAAAIYLMPIFIARR